MQVSLDEIGIVFFLCKYVRYKPFIEINIGFPFQLTEMQIRLNSPGSRAQHSARHLPVVPVIFRAVQEERLWY
jgi:hypothetical protein